MNYSVYPFVGAITSGQGALDVARQIETTLNQATGQQMHLMVWGRVSTVVSPGCLAGLVGAKEVTVRYDQLICREGASQAPLNESVQRANESLVIPTAANVDFVRAEPVPLAAEESVGVAAVAPVSKTASSRDSGDRSPLPTLIVGAVGVFAVLFFVGKALFKSSPPSSEMQPPPVAISPQVAPKQPRPNPQAPLIPTGGAASAAAEAPSLRIGDRWVTDVVDHQDARLSYRSERVVVEARGDRVVTSMRTLKNNYTRHAEYDSKWALMSTRAPNGAVTTFEPPLPYFQFPLIPGQSWQRDVVETTSSGARKTHQIRASVEAWESVVVPAGSFTALRVRLTDIILEGGVQVHSGEDVSWYVPGLKRSAKSEESSFNPVTGERRKRTISLVEFAVN